MEQERQTELCERCQRIRFGEEVGCPYEGVAIANLGTLQSLLASGCPLCALLVETCPLDNEDEGGIPRSEDCYLQQFSALEIYRLKDESNVGAVDAPLYAVIRPEKEFDHGVPRMSLADYAKFPTRESGYLSLSKPSRDFSNFGGFVLDATKADIDFAKQCISYCEEHHNSSCGLSQDSESSTLEGLRFIDCHSKAIVEAQFPVDYVALSYVWGKPGNVHGSSGEELGSILQSALKGAPKVVTDSIEVVLKLGLRYLWVDRYCVNQDDEKDKHNQIRNMSRIYADAYLTIIAAAGADSSGGLPGVAGTSRASQPKCHIGGGVFLVSTRTPPNLVIQRSTWASRGWTYQEGLFSRRRLIFSDQQLLFECNGMHCTETFDMPLDIMHSSSTQKFEETVPFGSFPHKNPGASPWTIMSYISDYSRRDLTYQTDAVNAIHGVLTVFEHASVPIHQLVGVPFYPIHRRSAACFAAGLCWQSRGRQVSRLAFPSWSWAGWEGQVDHELSLSLGSGTSLDEVRIWIENGNDVVELPSFKRLSRFLASLPSNIRYIHIETWIFGCSLRQRQTTGYEIVAEGVDGLEVILGNLGPSDVVVDRTTPLIAILVGEIGHFGSAFLIARYLNTHWERVTTTRVVDAKGKMNSYDIQLEWGMVHRRFERVRLG